MAIETELASYGAGVEVGSLSSADVLGRTPTWGKPSFSLVKLVVTFFSTTLHLKSFF